MKKDKTIYVGILIFVFVFSTINYGGIATDVCKREVHTVDPSVVLITGFEPFDIYEVNPSQLIAETLDGQVINGAEVVGIVLPVDFEESVENVTQAIEDYNPILVISLGLSPRTHVINVEKFGVNLKKLPRNENLWIFPRRINPYGPFIQASTLDTREIVMDIRSDDILVKQSLYAGMYVCNTVLYTMLGYIDEHDLDIQAGFIHVPLLPFQDPEGMELETMIDAVTIAIETSLKTK